MITIKIFSIFLIIFSIIGFISVLYNINKNGYIEGYKDAKNNKPNKHDS